MVRRATPRDVPVLVELMKSLIGFEQRLAGLSEPYDVQAEDLRRVLFGFFRQAECLVVEHEGEVVGYALLMVNRSTAIGLSGLHVQQIFVHERFRGKGLGQALMDEVARYALEAGAANVYWAVLEENQGAIRFIEAAGGERHSAYRVYRLRPGA